MKQKRGALQIGHMRGLVLAGLCLVFILFLVLFYIASTSIDKQVILDKALSSEIIGRVLDQQGQPVGRELVTVEWIDEDDVLHHKSVRSLTREEAQLLGQPSLEGYFIFPEGAITAKKGTSITIKSQPRVASLSAIVGEEKQDVGSLVVLRPKGASAQQGGIALVRPERETSLLLSALNSIIHFFVVGYKWMLTVVIVIGVGLWFFHRQRTKKKHKKTALLFSGASHNYLEKIPLTRLMTKDVVSVLDTTPSLKVAQEMLDHSIHSILVRDDRRLRGIITEHDFLEHVYLENQKNLQAHHMMTSHLITIPLTWDFGRAISFLLRTNISKLPLLHREKLAGIVTQRDLLRAFDDYFANKKHREELRYTPLVKDLMNTELNIIHPSYKLKDVVSQFLEKRFSYCLVSPYIYSENPHRLDEKVGIITTKDLLDEFYRNPTGFLNLKAINVMRTPLIALDPKITIIEANSIMLAHAISRVPVASEGLLLGTLNQDQLLESFASSVLGVKLSS